MLQDWGTAGKLDVKSYGVSIVSRAIMFCNQVRSCVTAQCKDSLNSTPAKTKPGR